MNELSKDYFDEQLQTLAAKTDVHRLETNIQKLAQGLDERFSSVNLKLDAIYQMLDVREQVLRLQQDMKAVKDALAMK